MDFGDLMMIANENNYGGTAVLNLVRQEMNDTELCSAMLFLTEIINDRPFITIVNPLTPKLLMIFSIVMSERLVPEESNIEMINKFNEIIKDLKEN